MVEVWTLQNEQLGEKGWSKRGDGRRPVQLCWLRLGTKKPEETCRKHLMWNLPTDWGDVPERQDEMCHHCPGSQHIDHHPSIVCEGHEQVKHLHSLMGYSPKFWTVGGCGVTEVQLLHTMKQWHFFLSVCIINNIKLVNLFYMLTNSLVPLLMVYSNPLLRCKECVTAANS